jgi:hypothetical protein
MGMAVEIQNEKVPLKGSPLGKENSKWVIQI